MAELASDPADRVDATFRLESGRALATLARLLGDLGAAEDAVQEAFVVALATWPTAGVPRNPGAWITTTARNKAIDRLRRESTRPEREQAATSDALRSTPPILHPVADDELQLMFTCCHPALAGDVRVTLTLRFVCGLRVPEIARLLLQEDEAVAKRLQRAKAKIRDAAIPFRLPPPELLPERLPSVLECLYLTFTEGYAASGGVDLIRADLCDESIRLARLLCDLLPGEAGPEALLALMLLQDSRRSSRVDADGNLVLLQDQDRRAWDHDRIAEGQGWLGRAATRSATSAGEAAFVLQAAIAAEHARSPDWASTDWRAIVRLYDHLEAVTGSPVVRLNRAVAVSFADGPEAALPLVDALATDDRLAGSHLLSAARADMRTRLGRSDEAAELYRLALTQAPTAPERAHVRRRLDDLARSGSPLGPSEPG